MKVLTRKAAEPLGENNPSAWAIIAGMRFILAVIVVLGHCCVLIAGPHDWTFIGLYFHQVSAVFGFFIISGYSIGASLQRNPTGFYWRRIVRIWPLYLACILLGLLASIADRNGYTWPTGVYCNAITTSSVLASILMLQTIVASSIPPIGQIWSLCPEWWHYVAAPHLKKLSSFTLLLLLALSFKAFMSLPTPPGGGVYQGFSILTLSWLWMTGFLFHRFQNTPVGLAIIAVPSLFAAIVGHFIGAAVFIVIGVLPFCTQISLSPASRKFLTFLGDVSFPLYLFHFPVLFLLSMLGVRMTIVMVAASLLAATLALYGIDYPARRLFKHTWQCSVGSVPKAMHQDS